MKILVLKNNINNELDESLIDKGLLEVSRLLKTIDFPHTFNIQKTSVNYTSVPYIGANPTEVAGGYQVNPNEVLKQEKIYGDHDVIALFYDPTNIKPVAPVNPTDNGEVIQLPSDWYGEDNLSLPEKEKVRVFVEFFLHELSHCTFWKTNKKDITHDFYTSAYSQKQPTDYYLFLLKELKQYLKPSSPSNQEIKVSKDFLLKEFVPKEIWEKFDANSIWFIDPKMYKIAQLFRDLSGKSTTINNWHIGGNLNNCGFRMPDTVIGGKLSQHKFGRAIDVSVKGMTPQQMLNIVITNKKKFMDLGLTVIEDIAYTPTWLHLDVRFTGLADILIVKP